MYTPVYCLKEKIVGRMSDKQKAGFSDNKVMKRLVLNLDGFIPEDYTIFGLCNRKFLATTKVASMDVNEKSTA